jgi:hypothetical protein
MSGDGGGTKGLNPFDRMGGFFRREHWGSNQKETKPIVYKEGKVASETQARMPFGVKTEESKILPPVGEAPSNEKLG